MSAIFSSLIRKEDRVISIVGAGGKTSLLFLLAHTFQKNGLKVITTTTTRILKPGPDQTGKVVLTENFLPENNSFDELAKALDQHRHITVAKRSIPTTEKLQGCSPKTIEQIFKYLPDVRIIVEADGARRLPLKTPGEHEPVIPKISDIVISMVGLDSIGQPLTDTTVFRAERVSQLTGLPPGASITAATIAQLATHPDGLLKGCPKKARRFVFLNKTDICKGNEKAEAVIKAAKKCLGQRPDFWIKGSIKRDECKSYKDEKVA